MFDKGIQAGIYYLVPLYRQPLYRKLGYDDYLPNSERTAKEVLPLPIHPSLTERDVEYIVESVIDYYDVANLK